MIGLLENKLKIAVALVALGLIYGVYSLYNFSSGEKASLDSELSERQSQTENLKKELEGVKTFAQNIPAVKQAFREQSLQLESVLESVPRNIEMAGLLRKLTMLAQNSGVEITSFKPAKEELDLGFFKGITVSMNFRGGFTQSLVFFDQVAKLKRVINFESVKLKAQASNKFASRQNLDTEVTLKAFRLGDS
ncbi:MAG: hypothetical protein EB078_05935 [Proteobacteria bacterium]|nr:hypothetical protein [Pseudomonadota bacterium]NDC24472.1 hypothetical protein [Pseudomonadota bacterium]NDD04425.1 hypothetical protein [Pseudomonadota bacterium]NDG26126.1 hypothetical protein [Pseudomonadota bacterium]